MDEGARAVTLPAVADDPSPERGFKKGRVLLFAVVVFVVYSANGREIGSGDTVPAKYLAVGLIRGDGFYLDRYRQPMLDEWPFAGRPYYAREVGGHYLSTYPLGAPILASPFTLPQVLALDWTHPGWEESDRRYFSTMAKRSAAALTTLTVVTLLLVMRKLGQGREAWLAALAAALGSNLWVTSSQSLWQHGPAALALTLLVLIFLPEPPSRGRFVVGGLITALLVASRPIDLVFAVTTCLWVACRYPRRLLWFLPPALIPAAALIGYNLVYLGAIGGFYSRWETRTFATPLLAGLSGTLFSPNRGLCIFSPWTLIAIGYAPFALARMRRKTLLPWLIASIIPHALLISTFSIWWGGHCFGPRFWTEVIPLLAIVFGFALSWAKTRCRPVVVLAVLSVVVSIGVQSIGAAAYPSRWNADPVSVDKDPRRLWSWSDTELSRCVALLRSDRTKPATKRNLQIQPAKDLPAPVKSPNARGSLDKVDCRLIQGWAWDPDRPDAVLQVELFDGEKSLGAVLAGLPRKDLAKLNMGSGKHGFVFATPARLKDGATHLIHATVRGEPIELNQSPKPLACPDARAR